MTESASLLSLRRARARPMRRRGRARPQLILIPRRCIIDPSSTTRAVNTTTLAHAHARAMASVATGSLVLRIGVRRQYRGDAHRSSICGSFMSSSTAFRGVIFPASM